MWTGSHIDPPNFRSSSNQIYQRRPWTEQEEEWGFGRSKDIDVDSVVNEAKPFISQTPPPQSPPHPESPPARSVTPPSPPRPATPPSPPLPLIEQVRPESPPTPPHSPPLPQPPKAVRRKQKRTYQDLAARNQIDGNDKPNFEIRDPEPQTLHHPPPPPPPPPPTLFEKASKSEKKRGGANATKDFLNSLRRKKKKQRQKSVENLNFLFDPESFYSTQPIYPPPSPPPPPPPPPPPAFFRNIFSPKRSTAKKFQSPAPPRAASSTEATGNSCIKSSIL